MAWRLIHPHVDSAEAMKAAGRHVHTQCMLSLYHKRKSMIRVAPCKHIAASVQPQSVGFSGYEMMVDIGSEHHAILDTVHRRVFHYSRFYGEDTCNVKEETLDDFTEDYGPFRVVQIPKSNDHAFEILQRARSKVGVSEYSLVFNNCETFANWCFQEKAHCEQVTNLAAGFGTGVVAGFSTGVVAGSAMSTATTTVATSSTSTAYVLGFIPWGTTSTAGTAQVATYSSGATVAVGAVAAVGTVTASLGALYGIRKWIQLANNEVKGRLPICVYNNSGAQIRVRLTSSRGYDFVYKTRSYFGVGNMTANIPSLMDGELAPPIPEESARKFVLHVLVERKGWFSSWTQVVEREAMRGDVYIYEDSGNLTRVSSSLKVPAVEDHTSQSIELEQSDLVLMDEVDRCTVCLD